MDNQDTIDYLEWRAAHIIRELVAEGRGTLEQIAATFDNVRSLFEEQFGPSRAAEAVIYGPRETTVGVLQRTIRSVLHLYDPRYKNVSHPSEYPSQFNDPNFVAPRNWRPEAAPLPPQGPSAQAQPRSLSIPNPTPKSKNLVSQSDVDYHGGAVRQSIETGTGSKKHSVQGLAPTAPRAMMSKDPTGDMPASSTGQQSIEAQPLWQKIKPSLGYDGNGLPYWVVIIKGWGRAASLYQGSKENLECIKAAQNYFDVRFRYNTRAKESSFVAWVEPFPHKDIHARLSYNPDTGPYLSASLVKAVDLGWRFIHAWAEEFTAVFSHQEDAPNLIQYLEKWKRFGANPPRPVIFPNRPLHLIPLEERYWDIKAIEPGLFWKQNTTSPASQSATGLNDIKPNPRTLMSEKLTILDKSAVLSRTKSLRPFERTGYQSPEAPVQQDNDETKNPAPLLGYDESGLPYWVIAIKGWGRAGRLYSGENSVNTDSASEHFQVYFRSQKRPKDKLFLIWVEPFHYGGPSGRAFWHPKTHTVLSGRLVKALDLAWNFIYAWAKLFRHTWDTKKEDGPNLLEHLSTWKEFGDNAPRPAVVSPRRPFQLLPQEYRLRDEHPAYPSTDWVERVTFQARMALRLETGVGSEQNLKSTSLQVTTPSTGNRLDKRGHEDYMTDEYGRKIKRSSPRRDTLNQQAAQSNVDATFYALKRIEGPGGKWRRPSKSMTTENLMAVPPQVQVPHRPSNPKKRPHESSPPQDDRVETDLRLTNSFFESVLPSSSRKPSFNEKPQERRFEASPQTTSPASTRYEADRSLENSIFDIVKGSPPLPSPQPLSPKRYETDRSLEDSIYDTMLYSKSENSVPPQTKSPGAQTTEKKMPHEDGPEHNNPRKNHTVAKWVGSSFDETTGVGEQGTGRKESPVVIDSPMREIKQEPRSGKPGRERR